MQVIPFQTNEIIHTATYYTQTKKKRPIFMVLYLSIQVRCRNKSKNKLFVKRQTHKNL